MSVIQMIMTIRMRSYCVPYFHEKIISVIITLYNHFNLRSSSIAFRVKPLTFFAVFLFAFVFLLCFLRQYVRLVPLATLQPETFLQRLGLEVRLPLQRLVGIIYILNTFFILVINVCKCFTYFLIQLAHLYTVLIWSLSHHVHVIFV